jgi:hypothetical protein
VSPLERHPSAPEIVVQGYLCPACHHVKDARDPDSYGGEGSSGEVRDRWCHNYRLHGGTRQKMQPVALRIRVRAALDDNQPEERR